MNTDKKTAHIAGALYLVVVLTGLFSLAYIPSRLIDWDNAAKTVRLISAEKKLFRLSIISSAICYIAFLLLPLILYKLLRPVNDRCAKLMVLFAMVSVPISFINLQQKYAVLSLVDGATHLTAFEPRQLQSMLMMHLDNYDHGILILQIFWGLWLFPFGYLVYKSNFLPKIFGSLLIAGSIGYLINFIGHTAVDNYAHMALTKYVTKPAALGGIGICLWLLFVGVKNFNDRSAVMA